MLDIDFDGASGTSIIVTNMCISSHYNINMNSAKVVKGTLR
jgi:hypothetical protein